MSRHRRPARAKAARARLAPRLDLLFAAVAVVYGATAAALRAWVCDDAFISFRYADNLVHGLGLVFNPGERVEGYTNPLWTAWTALGMKAGIDPETWSIAWGVLCYAGCIAVLASLAGRAQDRTGRARLVLPVAAILAAAMPDWNLFATSGLETTAFTFLVLLGFRELTGPRDVRPAALAGLWLALAVLTRLDGAVFALLGGLFLLLRGAPRARSAAAFAAVFLALWIPAQAWRVSYYGDFLPNTWYAKSVFLSWYSQGLFYLWIFLQKYWALAVGAALGVAALARRGSHGTEESRAGLAEESALALAFLVGYAVPVVKVGGDFMFARLWIPVVPYALVLLERGLSRWLPARPAAWYAAAAVAVLAVTLTPDPIPGERISHGIVNEWRFYTRDRADHERAVGATLEPFFRGLPVSMAFMGGEARRVYYAHPHAAIECATGLTDREVARQPLARRGRVGHEKQASLDYLLRRRVHFVLTGTGARALGVKDRLPIEEIRFGEVTGIILQWDSKLMPELARRGAAFGDFPAILDRFIAEMPALPDSEVQETYRLARAFYFEANPDSARERPFQERLRKSH